MCQEHGLAEMLPHCPHPGLKTWRAAGGVGMEGPLGLRTEVPAGVLSATVSRRHRSSPLFLHSLRSGSDVRDYSLTGYVWSAVTPSPEHLGDEVNLKVTVLCDSLREPLTFTCNCKLGGRRRGHPQRWGRGDCFETPDCFIGSCWACRARGLRLSPACLSDPLVAPPPHPFQAPPL